MAFKNLVVLALLTVAAVGATAGSKAIALEPGVFTNCVAWNGGITYAIINAGGRDRCFQIARQVTGNSNVSATWYGSAVLVQTPFTLVRS